MDRVVIFGRGGAGKSALPHVLGVTTRLPVIELDNEFWGDELKPLPAEDWARHQAILAERPRWIMDGDLGPHRPTLRPRRVPGLRWRRPTRPVQSMYGSVGAGHDISRVSRGVSELR